MALAVAVTLSCVFFVGGLLLGLALGRIKPLEARAREIEQRQPPPTNLWVKPTEPPLPGSRPEGPPVGFAAALEMKSIPSPHSEHGRYGVTEVQGLQCPNPRCRRDHPVPDIVMVGVGLSGSSYYCRHCTEAW